MEERMDKETFHNAYSLFRELKYNTRKLEVMPDMPYYFWHILHSRYVRFSSILDTFYKANPGSEDILNRMWYQASRIYPVKTHRQHELSERLRKWRVAHNVGNSDNRKPQWRAFYKCEKCGMLLSQQRSARFFGVCDTCNMGNLGAVDNGTT